MENNDTILNRPVVIIALIAVLVLCFGFWFYAYHVNVYTDAVQGALFEIAWLPVVFCTFAVPVFSLFRWYKDRWRLTSPFLLVLVLSVALILWVTMGGTEPVG